MCMLTQCKRNPYKLWPNNGMSLFLLIDEYPQASFIYSYTITKAFTFVATIP